MLRIAKVRKDNHNQVAYEKAFADKFALVEGEPNYAALERFAQKCIDLHCGDSLDGISARVYMDQIISMPAEDFVAWAKKFPADKK